MPLPKPPAKRASILSPQDYENQAAPRPRKGSTQKSEPPAAPALLELLEPAAPVAAAAPPAVAKKPAVAATTPKATRERKPRHEGPPRIFVLDTNVLMHDPMSLFRFDEHDVYLPMITLEELDNHKKGMTEVARNARQVSRELDALAANSSLGSGEGIALAVERD